MKILIVDDEPMVREGLKIGIDWSEMGFEEVECASDGKSALQVFGEFKPDILLTDIRMPFMNGLELTQEVKKLDPIVVVILLSAYDDFKYAQEAIRLGAFDYILKPVDVDTLKEIVMRGIDKRIELLDACSKEIPQLKKEDLKFFKAEYYKYPLKLEEELSKAIKQGETKAAIDIFNKIWEEFENKRYTEDFIKRWGIELVAVITRSIIEIGESADVLFKETDPWKEICKLPTLEEIYRWMKNLIEVVCEYVNLTRSYKNRKIIEKALELIHENYKNPDLSLSSVANHLYITPTYLSMLFKSEVGINFSDYLTNFRVEKAKELLKDPRKKIFEVAEEVGYFDQHYFSKVFKRITGFTPKEYREKIL